MLSFRFQLSGKTRFCSLALFSLFLAFLSPLPVRAGGGPENVFLVVNENSVASKTVANHYIDLRKIPPQNILHFKISPKHFVIHGETFKNRLLKRILDTIRERKLTGQIDYIVYSCGFPWRVNFGKQFGGGPEVPYLTPMASLTGATYFAAFVQQDRKEMISLGANFYCTPATEEVVVSRAFRSQYRWAAGGKRTGAGGLPYILSAMLGVNSEPGNTVEEMAWYLKRSAEADGTSPPGTIYYAKNNTIRSTVRDKDFRKGVRMVRLAGVEAEIVDGFFPQYRQDIMGVTCGHSKVDPKGAKVGLRPGAFCDNLTSAGGQFRNGTGQTCISEFMSLGAAGACGTVIEPMAVAQKFPNATLFGHYTRGCSLAEAFYQSVAGPYQQILIGDPLCQPWAQIPQVKVEGVEERSFLSGTVELKPTAEDARAGVAKFQLFIDGALQGECRPGDNFQCDTTQFGDGYHEFRVVATDKSPIETQGRWIQTIAIKNSTDAVQLTVEEDSLERGKNDIILKAFATVSTPLTVLCNGLEVAKADGSNDEILVSKESVGFGPLTFVATTSGEPKLRSRPIRIELRH